MASFQNNSRNATSPSQQNLTTTFKTIVSLESAATGRGQLFELELGADGPPNATDCQIVYGVSRQTVTGTGTASTPNPMNPADAASRTTSKINHTIEPTVTANSMIFAAALNQRASQRWIAAPGKELIWPNTSANGLVAQALSPTYAAPVLVTTFYDDL
jgi:hypothetical protein